jgi:hypothetical protein
VSNHLRTDLAPDALEQAIWARNEHLELRDVHTRDGAGDDESLDLRGAFEDRVGALKAVRRVSDHATDLGRVRPECRAVLACADHL